MSSSPLGVDQLANAADHLNDRYLALLGQANEPAEAAVRVMVDWARANTAYDVDAKRSLLAEDFEQVDHRPLGYPVMDRDDVVGASDGRIWTARD